MQDQKLQFNRVFLNDIKDIEPTDSLKVNFTDTGELFINRKTGKMLKISDLVFVDTMRDLNDLANDMSRKIYIVRETNSIHVRSNGIMVDLNGSVKADIVSMMDNMEQFENDIVTHTDAISTLTNTTTDMDKDLKLYADAIGKASDNKIVANTGAIGDLVNVVADATSSISDINISLVEMASDIEQSIILAGNASDEASSLSEQVQSNKVGVGDNAGAISTMNTTLQQMSNTVDSVNDMIINKIYNANINITSPIVIGDIVPHTIDIGSMIFDSTQSIVIDKISLRTSTVVPSDITIAIDYIALLSNGADGNISNVSNISIVQNSAQSSKVLSASAKLKTGKIRVRIVADGNNYTRGLTISITFRRGI